MLRRLRAIMATAAHMRELETQVHAVSEPIKKSHKRFKAIKKRAIHWSKVTCFSPEYYIKRYINCMVWGKDHPFNHGSTDPDKFK